MRRDSFILTYDSSKRPRLNRPVPRPISLRRDRRERIAQKKSHIWMVHCIAMGPPKPPVPHVAPIYRLTATALGAGMWFWLMYRAKKDGPVLMGWKHPWDH
ncbi:hypothetical protein ACQRIU_000881 [Beauveria bassiana]